MQGPRRTDSDLLTFMGLKRHARPGAKQSFEHQTSGRNTMIREETASLLLSELRRLTIAVERLAGPAPAVNDWNAADCFVWAPVNSFIQPVPRPNRIALKLIRGVDHVRDILHENTLRFAEGFAANNVLLWGARGMGKSSLVKAVHEDVRAASGVSLKLVEVHREDIHTLPALLDILKASGHRVIVFCDDLPSTMTIRPINR